MTRTNAVLWYFCLLFAAGCALAIDIFGILVPSIGEHIGGDFAVFWTAARLPVRFVYDFDLISSAQSVIGSVGFRPFVSPPTLLSWVAPFTALPFEAAFALWTALGLGLFYHAGRRLASRREMALAMLSPAVVVGAVAGQVTLFVGALVMLALTSRRASAAGMIFGLAATIKPQALLLLPVALLAGRDYRALAFAALTAFAICIADIAARGASWLEWLQAMNAFSGHIPVMQGGLNEATPTGFAAHHGLHGSTAAAMIAGGVALGLCVTWYIFRRTEEPAQRAAALAVGYVLCSPYAGIYELTLAAPAAAAILLDRSRHPLSWLLGGFGLSTLGAAFATVMFGAALLNESFRSRFAARPIALSTG